MELESSSGLGDLEWFSMDEKFFNKNIRKSGTILQDCFSLVSSGQPASEELKQVKELIQKWAEFLVAHPNYKQKTSHVYSTVSILIACFLEGAKENKKALQISGFDDILTALESVQMLWKSTKENLYFPEVFHCLSALFALLPTQKPQKDCQKLLKRLYDIILSVVNHHQADPNFDLLFSEIQLKGIMDFAQKIPSGSAIKEKCTQFYRNPFNFCLDEILDDRIGETIKTAAQNKPENILPEKAKNLVKIQMKAPKIFDKKNPDAIFQRKFETQKLRKKIKKEKSKILKDMKEDLVEAENERQTAKNTRNEFQKQRQKQVMRFLNEQQQ